MPMILVSKNCCINRVIFHIYLYYIIYFKLEPTLYWPMTLIGHNEVRVGG